jgi:hypothetical protein
MKIMIMMIKGEQKERGLWKDHTVEGREKEIEIEGKEAHAECRDPLVEEE